MRKQVETIRAESDTYGDTVVTFRGLRVEHFHDPNGNGPGKPIYQCSISPEADNGLGQSLDNLILENGDWWEDFGSPSRRLTRAEREAVAAVHSALLSADLF